MLVRYRAHAEHKTATVIGKKIVEKLDAATGQTVPTEEDEVVHGSLHHREMTEFNGIVTRSHDDGTHDLAIFPPNHPMRHVDRVKEGLGDHEFTFHGKKYPKAADGVAE